MSEALQSRFDKLLNEYRELLYHYAALWEGWDIREVSDVPNEVKQAELDYKQSEKTLTDYVHGLEAQTSRTCPICGNLNSQYNCYWHNASHGWGTSSEWICNAPQPEGVEA